jgi:hypothetical protein
MTYELNGETLDFQPEETVHSTGTKTFTFIKAIQNVKYDVSNKLRVYLEALPLTTTIKELVKDETTGDYSLQYVETTSRGKLTIAPYNVEVILQSSNLSFAEKWDGNFEIQDTISTPIELRSQCIIGDHFGEDFEFKVIDYNQIGAISEALTDVETRGFEFSIVDTLHTIMDYDVIKYYDIQYRELQNGSSESGTFAGYGFITYPPGGEYATRAVGYYMQLAEGVSTKITVTSQERTQLYLMDELTTEDYNFEVVGENNSIKWTSTGSRFWILVLTNNRQATGEYKIEAELIDDPSAIYISVENGYIGEDTTKKEEIYRPGNTVSIMGNLPSSGQYFNCWKTSNHEISRKQNYIFDAAFDANLVATYASTQPEAAPCAFIGKMSRTATENNFMSALETDSEDFTIQKLSIISTRNRAYIGSLTGDAIDGENVKLELEITENFPSGKYEFLVPVIEEDEDLYLRVEIKYSINGVDKYVYSNLVETHFADNIQIL